MIQRLVQARLVRRYVIGLNLGHDRAEVLLGDEDPSFEEFKTGVAVTDSVYGWRFGSSSLKVRCGSNSLDTGTITVFCATHIPFVGLPQTIYESTVAKELSSRGLSCELDKETKFVTCRTDSNDPSLFPDMAITVAETGITHKMSAEDLVEFVQSGSGYTGTYRVQVDPCGTSQAVVFGTPVLRTVYLSLEYFRPVGEVRLSMSP